MKSLKLLKCWSAYIFPKNNLRYQSIKLRLLGICGSGIIIVMIDNIWHDRKDITMNIQIFGTKKCDDTRKVEIFSKKGALSTSLLI